MAADLRERVARAIASIDHDEPEHYAYAYFAEADAVLAELGLTQAEPVGYVWQGAIDALRRGERVVETLLWPKPTGQAGVPIYAAPQHNPKDANE
jgi:hypothetical protein